MPGPDAEQQWGGVPARAWREAGRWGILLLLLLLTLGGVANGEGLGLPLPSPGTCKRQGPPRTSPGLQDFSRTMKGPERKGRMFRVEE